MTESVGRKRNAVDLLKEVVSLREANSRLLAALEAMLNEPISGAHVSKDDCIWCSPDDLEEPAPHEAWCPFFKARAAIAKAKEAS